jgi:hypothetical protein
MESGEGCYGPEKAAIVFSSVVLDCAVSGLSFVQERSLADVDEVVKLSLGLD